LLTGESGCGKTMLSRSLVNELDPDITEVALLTSPSPTPTELLREILYQVGETQLDEDHTEIVHRLNGRLYDNFSLGKTTLVIIDEGQLLEDAKLFEEIRLLLNFQLNDAFLITLLLIGQPELAERIRNWMTDSPPAAYCAHSNAAMSVPTSITAWESPAARIRYSRPKPSN